MDDAFESAFDDAARRVTLDVRVGDALFEFARLAFVDFALAGFRFARLVDECLVAGRFAAARFAVERFVFRDEDAMPTAHATRTPRRMPGRSHVTARGITTW